MNTATIVKMAWRNLFKNKRRTAITLSGIAFGVMLAVLFTGIQQGMWSKVIDRAARMGQGHVTIQHPDYLARPSMKRTVGNGKKAEQIATNIEGVKDAAGRITGDIMLATASQSYGAMLLAIDPEQESEKTLALLGGDMEGEFIAKADSRGIILGSTLASNLEVGLGRKVVYTMTGKTGEIVSGLARVKGILSTGSTAMDGALCVLGIDNVRELAGYGENEVTQVAVLLHDHLQSRKVAASLDSALGKEVVAHPWQKVNPDLDGIVASKLAGAQIMEVLIMLLVAAGIFNTLLVSVMERYREFGIMNAIGFTPGKLFGLVMWESLLLGILGLLAAAVVTAWPYYYMSTVGIDFSETVAGGKEMSVNGMAMDMVLFVDIHPEALLAIAAAALLATLLSGLYPAWKVGRIVPVESIKVI